ncbi:alpha/beta hydrolase family protein [Streptomyces sp. 15-116A]|uniref:alpha/beta hydrolase family protein n=1 Tax=Streptomyces sp. 15-116A TaxID=2259035 RepID=UPI0021B459F5|nr:alpha/beta hydrolase family protein [Streptomyces sp. 15-116A]MCT7355120.1 alpha/beta hydrolase family protein [Streptomyces sp. 15-116A]
MDLATLRALKPTEYSEAADGYRSASEMARAAKDRIDNQIASAMRNSLRGKAASAAVKQLGKLGENFHYIQVQCGLISTALDAFSYEMEAAKKKLDAALESARAAKLTVNADGSVTYPAGGEKSGDGKLPEGGTVSGLTDGAASAVGRQAANFDPNPHHRLAQDCADLIATALKQATEADEKWAPKLRALKADDDLTVSGADWADVKGDTAGVRKGADGYLDSFGEPPKNGTPAENAKWWSSLTEEQRASYIAVHPESIGWMDGIPATARDEASRTVLASARGVAQVELDSWIAKEPKPAYYEREIINAQTGERWTAKVPTEEWRAWDRKRKELKGTVDGMDALQTRIDTYQDETTRPYLLGFNEKGNGRVVVSIGNPDTADNVVTYVPGTGTKLSSIGGDINRAELLHQQAKFTDPAHKTASIMWLGYDAPQDLLGDATDPKYADNAREPLSNFLTGIDTTHNGNVNSTVLGHSYGTLVAGETMRDHPDLPVDRAILVGSPGVGVDHANDLNIGADNVFAATAKNDLVNLAPPPAGPLAPLNPKAYMRLFDDHSIMYGNDPISNEFGGRTFNVPDGALPGTDGLMPAHSQYWDGDSLKRMANIATGGTP